MYRSRGDFVAGGDVDFHGCVDFPIQNINMGAEVVVCINFTDRCNGTIFKADTVTNINCQNGFEGRNDFLFFHMDTAHGGIHIHRSSTLKPNH